MTKVNTYSNYLKLIAVKDLYDLQAHYSLDIVDMGALHTHMTECNGVLCDLKDKASQLAEDILKSWSDVNINKKTGFPYQTSLNNLIKEHDKNGLIEFIKTEQGTLPRVKNTEDYLKIYEPYTYRQSIKEWLLINAPETWVNEIKRQIPTLYADIEQREQYKWQY